MTIKSTYPTLRSLTFALSLALLVPIASAASHSSYKTIGSSQTAATLANSETLSNDNQPVSVYFLNGIFNSDIQSQTAAIALFNRLKEDDYFLQLVKNKQVSLRTLYNPTDPFLEDLYELDAQARVQKTALMNTAIRVRSEHLDNTYDDADLETVRRALFNEEMYKANQAYRAERYSKLDFIHTAGNRAIEHYDKMANEVKRALLAGDKVVIVAHSQGNYVAQGLYANLARDPQVKTMLADNFKMVGVANVAATTPSGSYLTHTDDQAVYGLHTLQGGQPMTANFIARFANGEKLGGFWESRAQRQNDIQNHGFIETYLSARFDKNEVFTPHQPEIVELPVSQNNTAHQPASTTIYSVIVTKVTNSLKAMLG